MNRHLWLSLALLIAVGGPLAVGSPSQAGSNEQQVLMADLTGAAEVPGPGSATGSGMAMVTVNTADNTMCVDSTSANIALPISGAHIHEGPADGSGSVVVGFIGGGGSLASSPEGAVSGCVSVDGALLQAIWDNPQNYYFNVHNAEFPGGAIRGQLAK